MIQKHDKYYIDLACQIATGSKCMRANYGTLIVSVDGRIVSTGYNGKPKGSINDHICYRLNLAPNAPKENCCLHSEMNALMFSSPVERKDGTIYVSGIPCNDCALGIMQSNLKKLVYLDAAEPLTGHRGSSDDSFWEKYGNHIERVRFTYVDWYRLYDR